ncbi:response regulator [Benzoatithermus flavus]|uniref:Response regulator n=1 Tax=Benzoatithermus flavus TaxID=3108223 RepID=A0ABU8XMM3_9PROT
MAELAWEVARHLPYLRRYARAILGDRMRGDASVRACLERLLPWAAELDTDAVKLQLYRTLHHFWSEAADGVPEREPIPTLVENQAIVAARVGHLSPTKRQILVLTALEGFTLAEAATVVGISVAAAQALLDQAKEEMRSQRASRILIIEDEPVIALDIAATVRQSGHTVVGIASTHRDAVKVAGKETPELILADIQLADDSSGLEAVQEILRDRYVPVVFITAFPERLLTGARPEPTFLITKPFDTDTLRVSISQALSVGMVEHLALQ